MGFNSAGQGEGAATNSQLRKVKVACGAALMEIIKSYKNRSIQYMYWTIAVNVMKYFCQITVILSLYLKIRAALLVD